MNDQELINQIVEDAIDKIWLPFEFKFIEWTAEYKAKYLKPVSWYQQKQEEWWKDHLTLQEKLVTWESPCGTKISFVPNPEFESQPIN